MHIPLQSSLLTQGLKCKAGAVPTLQMRTLRLRVKQLALGPAGTQNVARTHLQCIMLDSKGHILYNTIYMILWKRQNLQRLNR